MKTSWNEKGGLNPPQGAEKYVLNHEQVAQAVADFVRNRFRSTKLNADLDWRIDVWNADAPLSVEVYLYDANHSNREGEPQN